MERDTQRRKASHQIEISAPVVSSRKEWERQSLVPERQRGREMWLGTAGDSCVGSVVPLRSVSPIGEIKSPHLGRACWAVESQSILIHTSGL